jgi:hypothetical protein
METLKITFKTIYGNEADKKRNKEIKLMVAEDSEAPEELLHQVVLFELRNKFDIDVIQSLLKNENLSKSDRDVLNDRLQ